MDIIDRLHQKLEKMDLPPTESHNVKVLIRQALQAGLACNIPTDPLEGYANLTAAIKAGEPIDWEKLDGLVAKCVHSTLGDLLYSLEVDGNGRKVIWKSEGNFWFTTSGGNVWAEALGEAWDGQNGWTLWIEGEVPLRRKTADQLEVGTYFRSSARDFGDAVMYVGNSGPDEEKSIHFTPSMTTSGIPASEWEVIEEYGPFQKPEEKK